MLNQGDTIGPYVVKRYLGSSAIGAGYEVEHSGSGTSYLLNVLPSASPRIPVEISDQLGLVHPNLLTTLAILQAGGSMAVLTEFFGGRPLGDLMADHDLSLTQRLDIFREILHGVGAAHRSGVLHLDLRPSNVLVSGPIDAPTVKVAFFRVARLLRELDDNASATSNRFAAPEVMMPGIQLDAAADIFSLGAIAYEMFSGKPAFSGNTPAAIRAKTMGRFEPLSKVLPEIPSEVSDAIGQALQPRPFDRHATVHDFGLALFGPSFQVKVGERREVQDGAAKPRPGTPVQDSERQVAPPPPEPPATPEEEQAIALPRGILFGGIGAVVAVLLLLFALGALGATSVGTALDSAGALAGPTTQAAQQVSGLVDDVIAAGGDGSRLLQLQRAYTNASNAKKIPLGYRLYQEMRTQLDAADKRGRDPDAVRRVRYDLDVAGNQFAAYIGAIQAWRDACDSFVGGAAVRMGIADRPTEDLLAMVEGT